MHLKNIRGAANGSLQQMKKEPRKSYRSPQKSTSKVHRLSTTYRTPIKVDRTPNKPRQCPLHFNQFSHICLSCRKSICLRCVLTYCQQHPVRSQQQALTPLRDDLIRLEVAPRLQEIQLKLQQSEQRREYLQKKVLRLIESIESHFDYIVQSLEKKKVQIIQYYDSEFQRYMQEHEEYDRTMEEKAEWLRSFLKQESSLMNTIEDIDCLALQISQATAEDNKLEKKVMKLLMGKDKIGIDKLWAEENLEKVLFQIEQIPYKMEGKAERPKKRVSTENATMHISQIGFVRSNSNSKFLSGRKPATPSS